MGGPGSPDVLTRRAAELMAAGRLDEAEATFRRVLAAHPRHPVALWNLGLLLIERERHAEALALADDALRRQPAQGRALLLRGDALAGLERFDAAIDAYERAARIAELAPDALGKLGLVLAAMQDHRGAREALDRAAALRPDDPYPVFRRAIVRLQTRDFEGWTDYEARLRLGPFLSKSGGVLNPALAAQLTRAPTRDDLAGQRILLLAEQGVGDQVMFVSMVPDLAAAAASVACVCDARLVRLFAASFPGIAFAGPRDARIERSAVDRLLAMGSLGHAFRRREDDFPGVAYLSPSPEARARWAARLGPRSGALRVGIAWRGGLPTTRRGQRSLTLDQLAPVLDAPGCEFVSLQYGDVAAELAGRPIRAFAPQETDDFDDLAALAAQMDLVISVQTALVHVCGAIGQTCLTLVPHNAEWRYAADGPTMPWYRSVRLFRQATPGDWAPVIAQAAEALRARL